MEGKSRQNVTGTVTCSTHTLTYLPTYGKACGTEKKDDAPNLAFYSSIVTECWDARNP